jgi:phosphoserine aminotransferase
VSSNFLSRPIANIERFALIFAGAQKNIGPAGVTVLILRDDLLQLHRKHLHQHSIPVMMDYLVAADNDSLYNTPPTYPIYMAGKYFWIR